MPHSLPLTRFLDSQYAQGLELAAASDLLELVPIGPAPVQRYIARLGCRGLVRTDRGEIEESVGCVVGIHFPEDYLRRVQPLEIVRWIAPENVFHPNCALAPNGVPVVCVGKIPPGTPLVALIEAAAEIFSWQKVLPAESDALDAEACQWARRHPERLPVDDRPLRRPSASATEIVFAVEEVRR